MVVVQPGIHRAQRLLGLLLGLLILVSSIDRVPDPPSLKPQRGTAISTAVGGHQLPMVNQDRGSGPIAPAVAGRPYFAVWSLLATGNPLLRSPIYLSRASDSSPPSSAS